MLRGLLLVTVVFLLVWAALQASLVVYVEAEYAAVRDNYRKLLLSYLESRKEEGVLGAAWDATLALKREFEGAYGRKKLIPSRLVQGFYDPNVPASIPMPSLYWGGQYEQAHSRAEEGRLRGVRDCRGHLAKRLPKKTLNYAYQHYTEAMSELPLR